MSRPRTKTLNVRQLEVFVTALVKTFGTQALPLNGGSFTPQQVKEKVDGYIALLAGSTATKAAWSKQLAATTAAVVALAPLIESAKGYVRSVLGAQSTDLAQFGLTPRKKTPLTTDEQAEANAKAAATRAARHTVGPKEKQKIHGAAPAPLAPSVKPGGDTNK